LLEGESTTTKTSVEKYVLQRGGGNKGGGDERKWLLRKTGKAQTRNLRAGGFKNKHLGKRAGSLFRKKRRAASTVVGDVSLKKGRRRKEVA